MMQEKGLSNDPFFRKISDYLDEKMDWKEEKQELSGARGFLHGMYHTTIGTCKYLANNKEGSSNEYARAKIQFSRMRTKSPVKPNNDTEPLPLPEQEHLKSQ